MADPHDARTGTKRGRDEPTDPLPTPAAAHAPRDRNSTPISALVDILAATFPGEAVRLRATCLDLSRHTSLLVVALNLGALRAFISRADDSQADALRVALSHAQGRLREAAWGDAPNRASFYSVSHSAPAVEALLSLYPHYEVAAPSDYYWQTLIAHPRMLRVFLRDGRVDPSTPPAERTFLFAAQSGMDDATAAFLEDARIGRVAAATALQRVSANVRRKPEPTAIRTLRLLIGSPLCDAASAGPDALIASAGASDTPTLAAVLEWWPEPSEEALTAALAAACAPWRDPETAQEACSDFSALKLLLSLRRITPAAATNSLAAACDANNRDAVLLVMQAAGGAAAVSAEVACRVLGVVARVHPTRAGSRPRPLALDGAGAAITTWEEDAPVVAALLAAPRFDPLASGGGTALLARAAGAGRLELVRHLLADGRFFLPPAVVPATDSAAPHMLVFDSDDEAGAAARASCDDALACAARGGYESVVDALLACPRIPRTAAALVAAAGAANMRITSKLLAAGIAPSHDAVGAAARVGSVPLLQALFDAGGDPAGSAVADFGNDLRSLFLWKATPLRIALDHSHPAVVQLLLSSRYSSAVIASEKRFGSIVEHACSRLMIDSEHNQPLHATSLECLRLLLADPRIDANQALDQRVGRLSDDALSVVLAAPSFDPSRPNVARAVVAAAAEGRVSYLQAFLRDARIDPSANCNAALVAACTFPAFSLLTSIRDLFKRDIVGWQNQSGDAATLATVTSLWASSAVRAVPCLLKDPRVSQRAYLALEAAAQTGTPELVHLILAAHRPIKTAPVSSANDDAETSIAVASHICLAIQRGAARLDATVVEVLCSTRHAIDPPEKALSLACDAFAELMGYYDVDVSKVKSAFNRVAAALLHDRRVSPAPAAAASPLFLQLWAVRGGLDCLTRAAATSPAVLRAADMHIALIDGCAFGNVRRANTIAVDFLLANRLVNVEQLFVDDTRRQITVAETVTSLRSAVRRGNLPPDVIAELVSLPAAPDAFVSCVLLDVVSAIHEEAYNSCCALPLVFAEAHRVDEYCCSKDAFAAGDKEWEEPWCGFDVCKTCTYPPIYADCDSVSSDVRRRGAYTVAAALGSEGACEEWHCLGRCCDGEALLARVTALLAHPRIDPAALDSSVLLAAVKSGVAPPEVVIALLKDGRADPRKQPTLLEEACGQRAPCAATVAALLADPRVVVTDGALAAAAKGHAKVDLLDLFLRTGCGSSTLLVPAAPESSLPLPEQASSVSIRGALESAARAGRDSALHRLLGATCLLPGHATRRAIPLSVQSPADILAALCVAATSGHADCVATLLRAGCRLSSGGRLLFSAGAALQATFSPAPWGYSGPSASCTAGVVEALVRPCTREGADGICPGPHCSPADVVASLRLAAVRGGCASAVRALLAADPRPFDLSPTGPGGTASQSPLTMAAGAGETMLVLVLLGDQRCGSSPDELREAVAAAARGGHADTLQALLVAQLPSAPPPLALLPPPPPPSSAALCDVALCAAIDASHEAAVRAAFAIFRGWGAPPGTVCAAAALRVCDTGASPGCFAAVVTAAGVAGVPAIIATLAADDSAALRRLCASPTAHPELVAAVLRLGGGAVDATARNYEALRAAAHACNAGVVSVLISYSRFAAAAAAGAGVAAAAEALLGAASQEGCEGVVWLLAPRTAESETLLRAAEACARRGDAAALRAALAHVRRGDSSGTDDAASLVSRVRALSLLPVVSTATTGSGTPSSRRRAAVSRVVDAWLSAPGPSAL